MATPTPEDASLITKMLGALGAAFSAVVAWMWVHTHARIGGKADKEAFDKLSKHVGEHAISKEQFDEHTKSDDRQFAAILVEQSKSREIQAKIFDQMRDMETVSANRHIDILNAINGRSAKP
jgi:hypothetical protein